MELHGSSSWRPALAAALGGTAMAAGAIPVSGQGTWETTLLARDLNGDGAADAYYDSTLDISWMADGSHAATAGVDLDRRGPGILYSSTWTSYLSTLDHHGTTGWRLPYAGQADAPACAGGSGQVPSGIGCRFVTDASDSELAHLFYVTLGNTTGSLSNTANFVNVVQIGAYRFGTNYSGPYANPASVDGLPMSFFFATGHKALFREDDGYFGWAVRDGDVTPVPEAQTWALLLAGVAAVGVRACRRRFSDPDEYGR
jgi:hypothetical protein